MSYVQSENVSVFPTTYRTKYLEGKYTSENNFVNILNSITDIDHYVLGDLDNNGEWQQPWLKVVIHGYYFEIKTTSLPSNLWLGIVIERGNEQNHTNALVNAEDLSINLDDDASGKFKGLVWEISTVEPSVLNSDSNNEYYNEYWLRVTDSNGRICSRVRLKAESIEYNDTNSVKQKLDSKQDIMSAGNGLVIDNNKVSMTTEQYNKLQSLSNNGNGQGSDVTFVYFDNSGKAKETQTTKGSGYNTASSYGKAQGIYIDQGIIKDGQSIFASVNSPDNSLGKVGDLWFKYTLQ